MLYGSKTNLQVGDLSINRLRYADDAMIRIRVAAVLVSTLKEGCKNNGLSLNASKKKVLVFERNKERTECKTNVR